MEELLEIGFKPVGFWFLQGESIQLELHDLADAAPALYAFAVDGRLMYVGKTVRSLMKRLYGYKKPGGTQFTNIRVGDEIREALKHISKVEIFGFYDASPRSLGRFTVNLPAALEDDIIKQLQPPWNGGKALSAEASQQIDVLDEEPDGIETAEEVSAIDASQVTDQVENKSESLKPSFSVTIGKAYFNQGFVNVPVSFARYFGRHGEPIEIHASGLRGVVVGKINRTVNPNDTPRIMGGVRIRDWIQSHVRQGQSLKITVLGPNAIRLG